MTDPKTAEVKVEWTSHNPRYGGNFPPVKPDQWVMVRGNMIEDPRGPVLAGEVYWGDREDCDNPVRWYTLSEAPASPPAEKGEGFTVDQLAQEIRRVDGSHSLGAGALAEALMPFLSAQPVSPSEGEAVAWRYRFVTTTDGLEWSDWNYADTYADIVGHKGQSVEPLYTHPASDQSDTERMRAIADVLSHQHDWRKALTEMRDRAEVSPPDIDDRSYWQRQLDVLDRIAAALAEKAADK